ncbi:helix-turn-helix domain-containing protein [Streptomyces sp. NPDC058464]|uniref:helix-turn-helix domain-containing protein n=1 Tax=Streptomyces sp. NPDC058464 TaxID=3346511 RepID=UPI003648552D
MANPDPSIRTGAGRFARSVNTAMRDAEAARLRAQGWTYRQIADEFGMSHHTSAINAVRRAIQAACVGPAKELIELEVTRLEMISDEVLDILQRQHPLVSHGRVILGEDGQPLLDDDIKLRAVDRYIRARESFRRLLGLDQPVKVDATLTEVSQQDLELQEMLRDAKAKMQLEEQQIVDGGNE